MKEFNGGFKEKKEYSCEGNVSSRGILGLDLDGMVKWRKIFIGRFSSTLWKRTKKDKKLREEIQALRCFITLSQDFSALSFLRKPVEKILRIQRRFSSSGKQVRRVSV